MRNVTWRLIIRLVASEPKHHISSLLISKKVLDALANKQKKCFLINSAIISCLNIIYIEAVKRGIRLLIFCDLGTRVGDRRVSFFLLNK